MTVETPFRDFLAFWAEAADRPRDEQAELWDRLYEERHAELLAHYRAELAGLNLDDALRRYASVAGRLEETFAALDVERGADEVFALLEAPCDVRAIAFVGLFGADAWVDDGYTGRPVAFFALEAFGRPREPHLVAWHELAHVAHWHARDPGWDDDVAALLLMMEGVALTTTRRLSPGDPPERHFLVEDFAAWEADCDAAWPAAVDGLLAVLDERDAGAQRRFFWPDWGRPESDRDVPARIGYLVAARAADVLLERRTLPEIVRWPKERVVREMRGALTALR